MIIIIGNSYFGPRISRSISDLNIEKAIYLNTSEMFFHKIMFALLVPFSSVVYSISASIKLGGSLKIALFFKKKIVQHFIGSDVTEAISDYHLNKHSEILMSSSIYLTEIDWINCEIEDNLPLKSEVVPLPILDGSSYKTMDSYNEENRLFVLCYVGEDKELFYGINKIIEVARFLDDVDFFVMGSECRNYREDSPPNINYLGWVNNPKELMSKCDIYIRITEHDGLPFSVIEALACAKYVIYNYKLPGCYFSNSVEEIVNGIRHLAIDVNNGNANLIGMNYALSMYSSENAAKRIYKKIKCIV